MEKDPLTSVFTSMRHRLIAAARRRQRHHSVPIGKTEESSASIGQHRFSVDLIGMMRVCSWAGLYFKYSPMTVLDSRSTGFNPFSTGIVVLY